MFIANVHFKQKLLLGNNEVYFKVFIYTFHLNYSYILNVRNYVKKIRLYCIDIILSLFSIPSKTCIKCLLYAIKFIYYSIIYHKKIAEYDDE